MTMEKKKILRGPENENISITKEIIMVIAICVPKLAVTSSSSEFMLHAVLLKHISPGVNSYFCYPQYSNSHFSNLLL